MPHSYRLKSTVHLVHAGQLVVGGVDGKGEAHVVERVLTVHHIPLHVDPKDFDHFGMCYDYTLLKFYEFSVFNRFGVF